MTTTERTVFFASLPFTIFAGLILGRFLFVAACLVLDRTRRRRKDVA
ncbi:hypothetical protein L612_009300000050 [Rhodococcus rhodochrous J38]|nr:hypothetical protein [Rhodococcus rhodochrous]TWH36418.1 hypothetical protein L612_009300000050 [Rhodococcus rhodochrous J38]